MNNPLLVYMETKNPIERDAAWLLMAAEHIKNNTFRTWDIPNTLSKTIEGIANRMIERQ